jgi:hypothetical protein
MSDSCHLGDPFGDGKDPQKPFHILYSLQIDPACLIVLLHYRIEGTFVIVVKSTAEGCTKQPFFCQLKGGKGLVLCGGPGVYNCRASLISDRKYEIFPFQDMPP